MYLGELNALQKNRFLDLGISMAVADGVFADVEKRAIHLLCDEMRIEDRYEAEMPPEDAIRFFATEADRRIQRIVVFEMLGIAIADGVYDPGEQKLLADAIKTFSIDDKEIKEISETVRRLYGLYVQINRFIGA